MALRALALLVVLPAGVSSAAAKPICPWESIVPSVENLPQARAATLCLINVARKNAGRRIVHTTPALRDTAKRYATNMMHMNFFDHASPTGRTVEQRARASGYGKGRRGWQVGEILAWGEAEEATPLLTVVGWLQSKGHRESILDREWTDIGIGIAFGAPDIVDGVFTAATYAVTFGSRGQR